tara:strand:+ start:1541 stop:1912 length:372 start_codon:yes stop_codon:yes gene_type:complete
MGSHPINLGLRFLLELAALISIGMWGWKQSPSSIIQFSLAIFLPVIAAAIWGIFAVPDDPSRSGSAPIPTLGFIRLLIEFTIFTVAFFALQNLGHEKTSWVLGILTIIHYSISYDRIIWLLEQ